MALKIREYWDGGQPIFRKWFSLLQELEEASGESGASYDDTALKARVKALEDKVAALEEAGGGE